MRLDYFGAALGALDAPTHARFVLVAGAVPRALQMLLEGTADQAALENALDRAARQPSLTVSLRGAKRIGALLDLPSALALVLAGLPSWSQQLAAQGPRSVALSGAPLDMPSAAILQHLCALPEVSDAWFELAAPGASLWEWPLRVGVPRAEADLWNELANARYAELFNVEPVGEDDRIVDLLISRSDLAEALGDVPGARTVADAVLLLGSGREATGRISSDIGALALRYHAGAVGLCEIPDDGELQPWFQVLVRELSHNRGLPGALFSAREADQRRWEGGNPAAADFPAPTLFADPRFIAATFIADDARRLAVQLEHAPNDSLIALDASVLGPLGLDDRLDRVRDIGRSLKLQLTGLAWTNEGGDATSLVRMRRELERRLGRIDTATPVAPQARRAAVRDARATYSAFDEDYFDRVLPDESTAAAKQPEARDQRFVQALVLARGATAAPAEVLHLAPDTDYRLRVHIGADRGGSHVRADEPLDETQLPDRPEGHYLTLAWVPLSSAADALGGRALPAPESSAVYLPTAGDSTPAEFTLRCGERPSDFRARLLVLHENRVLQTLLMTTDSEGRSQLRVENLYVSGFTSASVGAPADIAFVVNDNPAGISGITTVAGGSVSFQEPAGMKASLQSLRRAVASNVVVSVGDEDATLASEANLQLMRLLAKHGSSILGRSQL